MCSSIEHSNLLCKRRPLIIPKIQGSQRPKLFHEKMRLSGRYRGILRKKDKIEERNKRGIKCLHTPQTVHPHARAVGFVLTVLVSIY